MEDNAPAVGRRNIPDVWGEVGREGPGVFSFFDPDGRAKTGNAAAGRGKEDRSGRKRDFNKDMETRRLNGEVAGSGAR
jgi:hypothetical protein